MPYGEFYNLLFCYFLLVGALAALPEAVLRATTPLYPCRVTEYFSKASFLVGRFWVVCVWQLLPTAKYYSPLALPILQLA